MSEQEERERIARALEASTAPTLEAVAVKQYVADCIRKGVKPTANIETEQDYINIVETYKKRIVQ